MKTNNFISRFVALALVALVGFSSCHQEKGSGPDSKVIDTISYFNGYVFDMGQAKKDTAVLSFVPTKGDTTRSNDGGFSDPVYTIFIDSSALKLTNVKGFLDNLEELVGSIIEIKNVQNSNASFRLLRNIVFDSVDLKLKIITPTYSEIIRKKYTKDNVSSISFVGVNLGISKNQIYSYEQTDIASLFAKARQLDTTKIANKFKCLNVDECNYFVITAATITKIETRLYSGRTTKVKVEDFPYISQAFGFGGTLYTSKSNDDYTLKYFIYFQVRDITSLLNR
jgi:hypothetical protein